MGSSGGTFDARGHGGADAPVFVVVLTTTVRLVVRERGARGVHRAGGGRPLDARVDRDRSVCNAAPPATARRARADGPSPPRRFGAACAVAGVSSDVKSVVTVLIMAHAPICSVLFEFYGFDGRGHGGGFRTSADDRMRRSRATTPSRRSSEKYQAIPRLRELFCFIYVVGLPLFFTALYS